MKLALFVFLRPTILHTRTDVSSVSNTRFQRLQAVEANQGGIGSPVTEVKRLC